MKKITKREIIEKYEILGGEMQKRGLKISSSTPLDLVLFKRAMLGIDIPNLGDVVVIPDYISIGGGFVKSPKDAKDVDLIIRQNEEGRDEGTELKLSRLVGKQTGKDCHFVYSKTGPHSDFIPMFDLVLRAKDETKRVKVKEDYNKESKIKKKKLSIQDYEYLLHHIEIDNEGKEKIHHCLVYDHIANMFEQDHLLVKDGRIYLNGKEVKEGVFHVLKGLESTQEVVWSDEEAEENKIKPKKMKSGMTLKEKAKEW